MRATTAIAVAILLTCLVIVAIAASAAQLTGRYNQLLVVTPAGEVSIINDLSPHECEVDAAALLKADPEHKRFDIVDCIPLDYDKLNRQQDNRRRARGE
jgi:hypothetical protein